MKYIADPTMHSMPAVTLAPNLKWLGCQSMDNKIVIYSALNRFKLNRKKTFKGHMVAGYACGLDFSPEMRYGVLVYTRWTRFFLHFCFVCLSQTATWYQETQTAKSLFGIGKLLECWQDGRHIKPYAVPFYGILTKHPRLHPPDGMGWSSFGTKKYYYVVCQSKSCILKSRTN